IKGAGFGSSGEVKLDGTVVPTSGWTDTSVDVTVPSGTEVGPKQLTVTRTDLAEPATGTNGLTVHVLGTGYDPNLYEVGPGKTYAAIQDALDVARGSTGDDLVVVYPGLPDLDNPRNNPRGAYYENLVMASPVKLQGVGPGGFQGNSYLPGSIIDASSYSTDLPVRTDWLNLVGGLSYDGNQTVNDSEGIYVLASESGASSATRAGDFTAGFKASIDGFDIRGGNQFGFPGNVNDLTGGNTGLPPNITTQGGAIFANSYAQHLQITNNVMENNGGGYGTVRIGTPEIPAPNTDQHNENVRIANNRVIANAGTNLAGGIGIFAGADGYEVENNDICGNFSLEYGGGLTVYGLSPNGTIHHNRVYLNYSNDEGGGIMIAGELPQTAGDLSPGTGPVDIYANQIQANMSNDDGGGIRFLMAGDHEMNVYNNMIVNNVSTHEGGGISLNDAPDVRVYNNTIMKNMTTATAITSNGLPAAAGLSTSLNSDQLQETLPNNAAPFSDPRLFNNVFWDNRAGTRTGGATTVTGLGIPGDTGAITRWDLGSIDASGPLSPTNSIIQANNSGHDYTTSPTNSGGNPSVLEEFDLSVSFSTWRQNPGFVDATLVTVDAPPSEMGDYHLSNTSPAVNRGAAVKGDTTAPVTDIDGDFRPNGPAVDAGADEIAGGIAPPVCPPECAAPTVSDVAAAPNPTAGAATVDLTALATAGDPADPVIQAEWFVGADPGEGAATAMDLTDNGGGQWGVAAQIDVSTWADGGYTLNVRAMGQNGGWGATASTVLTVSAGQQGPTTLYFSTLGNSSIPGVSGPFDDSDIYTWNNTAFGRELAATDLVVPAEADVDGYDQVDSSHFYVSFAEDTTLPDVGAVQDEDVVYYNGAQWSVYFDGTANGMSRGSRDLDAISVSPDGQTLYFSTVGNSGPPGFAGPRDDADVYSWNGTSYARVWDASASGVASSEDVDGLSLVNETNFYLSFKSDVTLTGIGTNQDEDVIGFANGTWSVYFDGTANGMTGGGRDLDAIDVP
ncbi:MAG: choice-of-anchor Q domain-containing protein, partial [Actinomycetes bacterium]